MTFGFFVIPFHPETFEGLRDEDIDIAFGLLYDLEICYRSGSFSPWVPGIGARGPVVDIQFAKANVAARVEASAAMLEALHAGDLDRWHQAGETFKRSEPTGSLPGWATEITDAMVISNRRRHH